jgi:hypothetical protein
LTVEPERLRIGSTPFPTETLTDAPERLRIGNTVGKNSHEAAEPSVFRNFPALLVCEGKLVGNAEEVQLVPLPMIA